MSAKIFKGLGLNIVLLGLVSLITDVSSEMVFSALPFFIASLGGGGVAVGLIGGLAESVSSLLKIFSGYWSDRLGKTKPFIFWGYFTSSVMKLFFPLAQSWPVLLLFSSLERVGKGIRTAPRDSLVAASTLPETRGKAFGFHRMMDTTGALLGSGLCLFLFWSLNLGFRPIFFISALVGFLGLIPFFWIKEKNRRDFVPAKSGFRITLKNLPVNFCWYLAAVSFFALANFTYMFFVLKAKSGLLAVFPGRLSTVIPIILYIWFNLIYAFFSIPCGILSDKIGRRKVLTAGYVIYGLNCLGFVFSHSLFSFILFFALYGISFALIEGNQRALAADLVEEEIRGTALGAFHLMISIAALLASLLAGLLWNWNPQAPFIYASVLSFLAGLGISLNPKCGIDNR